MTQTKKDAKGREYTITSAPATTPDGREGFRIECTCASHEGHGNAAVAAWPVAPAKICGNVLLANHPAKPIRIGMERKGLWAA